MLSRSVVSNSFVTPWAVAHQAPLSMGLSRQEYWSGLLFPSSGKNTGVDCCFLTGKNTGVDCCFLLQGMFPIQGSNLRLLHWQTGSLPLSHLLLLLLRHFSRVWLCATPQTAAHQAPQPLGFSRQEHWSGLPFPSPIHESEKWKWSRSVVSDPQRPHGLQLSRLLRPWDLPGKTTGVGFHCLLCRFPVTSYKIQWWFTGIGCVIWLFSVARCTVRASWELLSLRSWRLH